MDLSSGTNQVGAKKAVTNSYTENLHYTFSQSNYSYILSACLSVYVSNYIYHAWESAFLSTRRNPYDNSQWANRALWCWSPAKFNFYIARSFTVSIGYLWNSIDTVYLSIVAFSVQFSFSINEKLAQKWNIKGETGNMGKERNSLVLLIICLI